LVLSVAVELWQNRHCSFHLHCCVYIFRKQARWEKLCSKAV